MNILWLTWKDRSNPESGGAEIINEELAKRLVKDGHTVIFLVAGFKNCKNEEIKDGYKIIRLGSRWSVYWQAYKYYKKNFKNTYFNLVIDEINTIPFFAKFYVSSVIPAKAGIQKSTRVVLFIHQLCREIWFYQIFFPLNLIGYLLEPIYLWLLRDRKVITVSESTKKDLMRFGFKEENIKIIPEGIELEPIKDLENIIKYENPTILYFGAIRAMKRPDHILKAFEIAKKEIPNLKFKIAGAGEGNYFKKFLKLINNSKYKNDIEYLGKVDKNKKIELMQKSHILCVTSVKEGWGLVVTEANSQGTPAIVYDIDGLRDSVKNNETGIICEKNNSENLAKNIIKIINTDQEYKKLKLNSLEFSKEFNFEKSYYFLILNN